MHCEKKEIKVFAFYCGILVVSFFVIFFIIQNHTIHLIKIERITTATNNVDLYTWWHTEHESNSITPIPDNIVRRSTFYNVQVQIINAKTKDKTKFDSFVYMTIPRSGRAKWGYDSDDGAEFSSNANLTMSWTSFLYASDCWVYINLRNNKYATIETVNDVTIRPTALNLAMEMVDNTTARILIPYSENGFRFSVEFKNQLYVAYNDLSGTTGKLNENGAGRAIHTEPRNALLIFAEPMITNNENESIRLIPTNESGSIFYPEMGQVDNLNNITEEIIYFEAGIYYMPWNYHAKLPANVRWIYFEPGAFVKGAFQFLHNNQKLYKVTGFGVLSGEKYVYEPDTNNNYQHKITSNCHGTCVKLLRFCSSYEMQQQLDLHGVTFMEPPYHSFVVYGDGNSFQMKVENFKMIGAWYWQTDGLELYSNSTMKNVFIHSNDDVLKIYHNNLKINNTVIWKNENGPVFQWGWAPRNITDVQINNTFVIHNKMYWADVKENTCIINSCTSWSDTDPSVAPNANTAISNVLIENTFIEGATNCAIRIYTLSNTSRVHIKNLLIDNWNDLDHVSQISKFQRKSGELLIGNEKIDKHGLKLENYRVNGQRIHKNGNNWNATSIGRLDFDVELWNNWNAF